MTPDDRSTPTGRLERAATTSRQEPAAAPSFAHVLVPLDGSAVSEQALACAAVIARRSGARITLAHVREELDAAEGPAESYPESLLGDPRLGEGLDVRVELLHGSVRDALLDHAAAHGVDLIVMTSRGRGGIERALFGSVADAVVRNAQLPVLIVWPQSECAPADAALPPAPPFRRILVPLDGSTIAERIIPYALALGGTDDVHYVLLRVHPALTPDGRLEPGPILGQRTDPAGDGYLSTTAARIADRGALVSARWLTHGSNADVIVSMIGEEDVDLVAMTTRGAGGVDRMIFGSVADEVVRRAPCHVLVLRPPPDDDPPPPVVEPAP